MTRKGALEGSLLQFCKVRRIFVKNWFASSNGDAVPVFSNRSLAVSESCAQCGGRRLAAIRKQRCLYGRLLRRLCTGVGREVVVVRGRGSNLIVAWHHIGEIGATVRTVTCQDLRIS